MPTFWGTNNKKLFNENKSLFDSKKNILDGLSEKLTEAGIPQVKPFEKKPNTTIKASFGDLLQSPFYLASKFVVEPTFKFLASGIELATKKETPRIEIPVIGKTKFFGEDKLVNIASYQNQYNDLVEAGVPEKDAYKNVFVSGLLDAIQIASPIKSTTKFLIPKTSFIKPKITGAISREQLFDFFSGRKSAAQLGMSDDIVKTISEKMKIMPTKEKIDFLKGFDLIEAEPSFIGRMFGVTKQEAESLMKKLYGGPARQASFGELPGTREVPGQAPAMGLSTRKVETVGKTTSLDEFVKTDDIIDVDSKLINEAKKYKSVEEFINAQGTPVYHGSDKLFTSTDEIKFGDDVFYTLKRTDGELKELAESASPDNYWSYDDLAKMPANAFGKEVSEFIVNFKNPKIVDAKGKGWMELTDGSMSDWTNKIVQQATKSGKKYDGIIIKNIEEGFSGKGTLGASAGLVDDYIVLNKSAIKTKSQLEDIWKKAQGEKEAVKDIKVYRGEGKGIGNSTYVKGEYFADSEEFAKQFGDVTEYTIPSDAKIFNLDDIKNGNVKIPENILVDQDALTKYIIDKGFEYTKNTNTRGIEYVKLNKTANDLQNLANTSNSLSDFKKRVMDNYDQYREELARLSKNYTNADISRLRDPMEDIWNKTQEVKTITPKTKPSIEPLIEEAKKYKSADEFIGNNFKLEDGKLKVGDLTFNKIYRGGEPYDYAKTKLSGKGVGSYFTNDKDFAKGFADELKTGRYGKKENIGIDERFISPDSKILTRDNFPKQFLWDYEGGNLKFEDLKKFGGPQGLQDKVAIWAKNNGYDIVNYSNDDGKNMIVLNGDKLLSESQVKSQLTDIWKKAQGISKNEPKSDIELTDNEKVIQEKISKQDFENIVERFWPKVKEWYSVAEVGVDDQPIYTFKEYLEKVDGSTIELELDSDYVSNRAIHDLLGDEEIYISEVVDMYKEGTLRDTISREAYKIDLAKPAKTVPEKGKRLFYEKEKSYTGDIKELLTKASTKVTPSNKLATMEARRKLYLEWATNPNLAEELGISQSILNKKIKSISGTNVEASKIQQRVNEGIPEQYQWTGISNSNFLNKTKVTLKDVDKVVNNIDDKTAKLGTYQGKELRTYIMNTFLSIDTRLRYDDLNFDIHSLERALGQYSNSDLTITIAQQSQHTVAHEIGHYLDYRWAREMGVDSSLADANYNWNYIQEKYKLPDEQIAWAKEYIKFVKNLSQKSEIGYSAKRAEYLQSPTEIFARFIDRFVDWTASKSGYHYSETNYYDDKFAVSDFYDFIKLLQKKAEIDSVFNIKPLIAKGRGVVNANEKAPIEAIKDLISFMEEVLSNHPGKELIKYVSKSTGRLPEITGKRTMQAVSGSGKIVKTSEFGVKGDDILQSVAGYGKDGDDIIEEYKRMKDNLNALKEDLKEIRTQESLDRISKKLADEQEKLIQFSKQYPELARFTLKLTEQETRGAIKGYKLGLEVASRTIKKDVMDTVKAAYDKKIARIKDSKEILQNRRTLIKAVQKQFGIGDGDLKAITRRDIRLMSNYEFKQFLDDIRAKSEEFMVRRQAQNELIAQINEKELNIEPLREAMKFPPISEMSTEQLRSFDAILEKYKQGDVFLSKRKLETIERTELKDIKTYREAREILAKKIGVKPEELNNIKISEFDRFKGFSSLAETNPFFKMVVEETTKLRLQADAEYLAIEKQANKLAKKVKTTFMQKLIPQQKNIRAWFEAEDKSTVRLTKEESDLVNFMMKEWGKARDELVIKQVMDRGIQTMNYFTHIRRGILEAVKEDGVIQAAKEVFDQYKMDEQNFNILDTETGEVLAMDKFFRFALRRTGELKPTENIVGAFLNYMKMYKRKQALDEIVPLIDTYAHALTPKGTTEKGLLLHGDMIRFMKEWLNTQKGRRITLLSKEGGKIDWALKSIKSFTTLLDIALNIPVSVATQIGEQAIQYQLLGKGKFLKAKYRALTKRGRRITNKYRNLVGKNPWTQLVEPMRSIGDRLNEGIFTLFQDANIRRNKNVMLGLMTKEEWSNETITPERLAQLKIATGRYGVVDGLGSIIGATPESKIVTQYKTWAIPIMTSQVKNLTYMAKYLGTLGKANKKEAARAMAETWRMLELGAFVAIVAGAFVDKEDDSFLGKLKLRAIQEANTLFGAAPAMTTIPRMIGFLTDIAKNTISLIKLEEYKANKFGEYEAGDLRGLKALEKMLTPRAIKQFQTPPIKTIDDVRKEIKEDIESGALSISAAKEKYISELNKLKTADKKARFKLKQDEYKKDLAERIKNKEITISEAKEEYIDYVEANVDLFSSKDEGSFIDKVLLYAKAFGTDPITASIYLFQGEKIRRVDNGAIIVERMTVEESQGIKKERGATSDMILDHIIPLQLGGSNSKNNLKLVDTDEWSSYTPVENYIGDKLRAGMIDKKEAQRLIKEFKDGKITKEQIMK